MHGSLPAVAGAASIVHEVDHDESVYHHHEDDGSVHYDDSAESVEHTQEHASPLQPVGFGLARLIVPSEQAVSELGSYLAQAVPEPFLDGPHRPPACALGHAAGGMLHA
ncbi:hypothetical protein ACHAC9_09115 [Massilia sp. CMS3.1]|uniref:hypothetical protein n=1 Tax=Massilia sp. CMS3.1 TaxID=3373083 RepID=UPI003EE5277F